MRSPINAPRSCSSFKQTAFAANPCVSAPKSARIMSQDRGALWMRVDDQAGKITAFDNMVARRVKGSTDWTQVEIVLRAALNSQTISFGAMLVGKGEFAMSDIAINAAPMGTQSTTSASPNTIVVPSKPTNIDFKQ